MRLLRALLLLCFLAPAAVAQSYYSSHQNFKMDLPGEEESTNTDTTFGIRAYNYNKTVGVSVWSPDDKVSGSLWYYVRQFKASDDLPRGAVYDCGDYSFGDDATVLCEMKYMNADGVHVQGRAWFCIHYGYLYEVQVLVTVNSGHDADVKRYLDSFEFLE